jgi:hypothetical protein
MKLLRYLAASLFLALSAFGQSTTSAVFAAGVSSISTTPVSIASIQLYDTSGTNNLIILYDNESATSTNRVYAAYTGVTQYTTNVVQSFTDFTGVAVLRTNTLLATVNVTVAAATNQARRVWTATVPANSFTTLTPTTPLGTTFGLQIKANGAGYYNLSSAALP